MIANFKAKFSNSRTFRDITKQRPDIVGIVTANNPGHEITKIYECKDTVIIHSKGSETNYASMSHAQGVGYIRKWEIAYAINRILKVSNEDVTMSVSRNGVIHLRVKEESTLKN